MPYISKKFHLQHKSFQRCLNGIVISYCLVVMSGCENIRFNDISKNGNKTLFYSSPFLADQDEAPPQALSVTDNSSDENLYSEPRLSDSEEPVAPITKEIESTEENLSLLKQDIARLKEDIAKLSNKNTQIQNETALEHADDTGTDVSVDNTDSGAGSLIPDIGFSDRAVSLFNSDSKESEFRNENDDQATQEGLAIQDVLTENKLFEHELAEHELTEDLQKQSMPSVDQDVSNEQLISQINELNESEPSAAGQSSFIDTHSKGAEHYEARVTTVMSKQLKRAIAVAKLEIFQWQLEMQKAANNTIDCRLSSPTIQLDSPNYTTQLWLNIENNRFIVNATTDIDPSLSSVGLYLESGDYEPFSQKKHSHYVIWEGDIGRLLEENKTIKLVISGNDLQSEIQSAAINLASLKDIYPKYQSCTKRLLGWAK